MDILQPPSGCVSTHEFLPCALCGYEEKTPAVPSTETGNVTLNVDTETVQRIRERINRLERGERDPHVKDWRGAYYGDVYFLLGLRRSEAVKNHGPMVDALRYVREQVDLDLPRFKEADDSETVAIEITVGWLREVRDALSLVEGEQ